MKRQSFHFARIILVAALVMVTASSAGPTRAEEASLYIAAGDSIAAGVGASLPRTRGYAALVGDWMQRAGAGQIIVENVAVPGETAATFMTSGQLDAVLAAVETATTTGMPLAAISLTLGGNELLSLEPMGIAERQEGLATFAEDYRDALSAVREAAGPETPIVVTTYYDLSAGDTTVEYSDAWWIEQFNVAIRAEAEAVGAAVADVAPLFIGSIPEYTYYPFDVHPTNAGHAAIARAVSSSLGVSGTGPAIEVVANLSATRPTPTLRFTVLSDFGVATLEVASDDAIVHGPFEMGDGEFVALLDLEASGAGEAVVTITAIDQLGAEVTASVTVALPSSEAGTP